MYRHPDFVLLHLQKTAGTHVSQLLKKLYPSGDQTKDKHLPLQLNDACRFVFAGARNPWDFYVSLFSFTGQQFTPPYWTVAGNPRRLAATYDNPDPHQGFRNWMRFILSKDCWHRNDAMIPRGWVLPSKNQWKTKLAARLDGIVNQKPKEDLGVFTLWLCSLGIPNYRRTRYPTGEALLDEFNRLGLINDYYRVEHLTEDTYRLLDDGLPAPEVKDWEEIVEAWASQKTNASRRPRDYRPYYDDDLAALVAERDAHFIEKFAYRFDPAADASPPPRRPTASPANSP